MPRTLKILIVAWFASLTAVWAAVCIVASIAHADTPAKPFIVTIESNVVAPCTITLDDPKVALAWIQLVAGSITPKQMSDIAHMLHPETAAEVGVKNLDAAIKDCIVGNDA